MCRVNYISRSVELTIYAIYVCLTTNNIYIKSCDWSDLYYGTILLAESHTVWERTHRDESHVRLWTQHYGRQQNILDFLGNICAVMVVLKVLEFQFIHPANMELGIVMAAVPERSCWQAANSAEVSNNKS